MEWMIPDEVLARLDMSQYSKHVEYLMQQLSDKDRANLGSDNRDLKILAAEGCLLTNDEFDPAKLGSGGFV